MVRTSLYNAEEHTRGFSGLNSAACFLVSLRRASNTAALTLATHSMSTGQEATWVQVDNCSLTGTCSHTPPTLHGHPRPVRQLSGKRGSTQTNHRPWASLLAWLVEQHRAQESVAQQSLVEARSTTLQRQQQRRCSRQHPATGRAPELGLWKQRWRLRRGRQLVVALQQVPACYRHRLPVVV